MPKLEEIRKRCNRDSQYESMTAWCRELIGDREWLLARVDELAQALEPMVRERNELIEDWGEDYDDKGGAGWTTRLAHFELEDAVEAKRRLEE